jgi:hypothetical protein
MTAEQLALAVKEEKEKVEGLSVGQKFLYIAAQKLGVATTADEIKTDGKAVVAKIAHIAADQGLTLSQTLLAAATALANG